MTITLVQSKNTTNSSMYYRILNHICVHVCTLKDEDGKQLDISVPCPLSKGGFLDFLSSFPLSVQSLSCVQLFATPWIAACQHASMPGFPALHQLPELGQILVHSVGDAIQPSHPVIPFSPHLQSFPASGSFPISQFFTSGGQTTGISASASVLPMHIQDCCPSGWTGWISLQSKRSQESSPTPQFKTSSFRHSAFFIALSHPYMTTGKPRALTRWTFVGRVMPLPFNMLSRLVIAFLPRSKCLLISWVGLVLFIQNQQQSYSFIC